VKFVKIFICIFYCLPSFGVVAMDLPSLAFSKDEGPALAKYHSAITGHAENPACIRYFMPKSESELATLYSLCISGKIDKRYAASPSEALWGQVTSNVQYEFMYRCKDGDKSVVDEYLSYFRSFIEISNNFQDQAFLEILYSGGVGSLREGLKLFIINLEQDIKKNPDLTRESTHLPYTVYEIDKILNASPNFQNVKLAEYYRKYHLTDEFRSSPEYQAMFNAIAATFEEEISITDLCTKE
jgi:hypothetical protein